MYRHLLLATSLKSGHELLALRSVQLAEYFSARLSLVYVFDSTDNERHLGDTIGPEKKHIRWATEALACLGREMVIPFFDQRIVMGNVPQAIFKVAKTLMVDAIIVGASHKKYAGECTMGDAPCDLIQMRI